MKQNLIILFVLIPFFMNAQFHITGEGLPCLNKNFKIAAHLGVNTFGETGITEEEVIASIEEINKFFEPICVSFSVCQIDIMENYNFNFPQGHLFEEAHGVFGEEHLIDIYYCFMQVEGPFLCGFTDGNLKSADEGAIFLNKRCLAGLPHEMGHLFGLFNTNVVGGNNTLVDNSNCETTGDLICDTPSDPYDGSSLSFFIDDCQFIFDGKDANGDYYIPDVGNIMSPYLSCYCGFSREQFLKMIETYNDSPHTFW